MPGHDTLAELTKNQTGTGFDGPFLVVGEGAPDNTVNFAGKAVFTSAQTEAAHLPTGTSTLARLLAPLGLL